MALSCDRMTSGTLAPQCSWQTRWETCRPPSRSAKRQRGPKSPHDGRKVQAGGAACCCRSFTRLRFKSSISWKQSSWEKKPGRFGFKIFPSVRSYLKIIPIKFHDMITFFKYIRVSTSPSPSFSSLAHGCLNNSMKVGPLWCHKRHWLILIVNPCHPLCDHSHIPLQTCEVEEASLWLVEACR